MPRNVQCAHGTGSSHPQGALSFFACDPLPATYLRPKHDLECGQVLGVHAGAAGGGGGGWMWGDWCGTGAGQLPGGLHGGLEPGVVDGQPVLLRHQLCGRRKLKISEMSACPPDG